MKATISVPGNQELIDLFAPEDKELSNGRARYSIEQKGDTVVFTVEAHDAVALRAMLSGITKTLAINDKMGKLVENDK